MPIYDYGCTACGVTTEFVHGIHESGPRFCPACGAEGAMKKAFAAPTVHFKGSGWAKKDRGASASTKAAARASGSGDASSKASGDAVGPGTTSSGGGSSGDGSAGATAPSGAATSGGGED